MGIENCRKVGIENCRVLSTESVRVRALPRGGSGATGVGQRVTVTWGGIVQEVLWVRGPSS